MPDAPAFLKEKAAKAEIALRACLDELTNVPDILGEAMGYSLLAGGKRLRPALALAAAELVSGDDTEAIPAACALEMVHTYSLIHDDLPCMDDDDLRRGRPTLHKQYDEATAVLAGDALLTLAFETAAKTGNVAIVRELAKASGAEGMVAGQVLDMAGEGQGLPLEAMQAMHACKTGALIRAAVRLGALAGGATEEQLGALSSYGEHLGLAFQIVDDILDIVGDEATLGKPVGSDAENSKSTYPSLVGLEESRRLADEASQQAIGALTCFGTAAAPLCALAEFVVARTH